jgi:hypothetical protein
VLVSFTIPSPLPCKATSGIFLSLLLGHAYTFLMCTCVARTISNARSTIAIQAFGCTTASLLQFSPPLPPHPSPLTTIAMRAILRALFIVCTNPFMLYANGVENCTASPSLLVLLGWRRQLCPCCYGGRSHMHAAPQRSAFLPAIRCTARSPSQMLRHTQHGCGGSGADSRPWCMRN